MGMKARVAVVPAKAGTHVGWIPAFAGMTSTGAIFRRAKRRISAVAFHPLIYEQLQGCFAALSMTGFQVFTRS